jgi:hypothetical protein
MDDMIIVKAMESAPTTDLLTGSMSEVYKNVGWTEEPYIDFVIPESCFDAMVGKIYLLYPNSQMFMNKDNNEWKANVYVDFKCVGMIKGIMTNE